MTLHPEDMKSSLRALFAGAGGYSTTASDAGRRWADIYVNYANDAVAAPTAPLRAQITLAGDALAAALASAFTAALGAPPPQYPTLKDAMVTAFSVFWPAVQFFSPLPPAPPTVTGIVGISALGQLSTDLTNFFEARDDHGRFPASDDQANRLGALLHSWTTSVTVTNTPLTGTPTTVQLA